MYRSFPLLLCLLSLLSACTAPDAPPHPLQPLQLTDDWRLKGKLGIRSPDYNGSMLIDWQNSPDHFVIALTGLLGVSVARIESKGDVIVLTTSDETVALSSDHLQDRLGYDLPLDHLDFWIRGVADPDELYTTHADGFTQAGWTIDYLEYRVSDPVKIRLTSAATHLTLAVRSWVY